MNPRAIPTTIKTGAVTAKAARDSPKSDLVLHPRKRAESGKQYQAQENGDCIRHAVQEPLRRARDQAGAGGEFEGQPEQQNGHEVERRRPRDEPGPSNPSTNDRRGCIPQHQKRQWKAERARQRGRVC